ncbi:MAG: hypothetical protein KatS3mg091_659 [Patescibacteria group bacterium]|nr:MAG: hypothetical protein KatS3mg091_659 [Patescibacteria group bacterium]
MGLFTLRPGTINASSIERQSGPSRDSVSPYKDVNNIGIDIDIDIEEIVKNWLKEKFNLQEGEFDLYILGNNFFGIKLHEIKAGDQIENSQGKFNSISPDKPQVYGFIKEGEQKVVLLPNIVTPYGRFYLDNAVTQEDGNVLLEYKSESGVLVPFYMEMSKLSENSIADVLVESIKEKISDGKLVVVSFNDSREPADFYQIESPIATGGFETEVSLSLSFNSVKNQLSLSFGDSRSVVIQLPEELAEMFKQAGEIKPEFVVDENGNLAVKGLPEGVSLHLEGGYPFLSYQKTTVSGKVEGNSLNVRSGPGTNYPKIDSLSQGTEIPLSQGTTFYVPEEGEEREYSLGLRESRDKQGKPVYEIMLISTGDQQEAIALSGIKEVWARIGDIGDNRFVAVRYNGEALVALKSTVVEENIEVAPSADLLPAPDFENAQLKAAVSDFVNAMEMVGIEGRV